MTPSTWARGLATAGLAALLALPAAAFAAGNGSATTSAPGGPMPFSGPVQGKLGGSNATSEELQFAYPGDGSQVTLDLSVDNPYPLETGAAGFTVTMPDRTTASNTDPSPTTGTLTFSSTTAGQVLIQVFNYDATNPIAFTLTPLGLPAAVTAIATGSPSTAAVAPTAAPATVSASAASVPANGQLTGPIQGTLGGDGAQTQDLTIPYTGNGSQITLTMVVDDPYPLETGAAGFTVTLPDKTSASNSRPNPTTADLTFSSTTAGTILVRLFDWDPAHPIRYTLTPQGLPTTYAATATP